MKHKAYFTLLLTIVMLAGMGLSASAQSQTAYVQPYDALLKKYVKKGTKESISAALVRYDSWGKDPLHKKALSALLGANPQNLKGRTKMAFWINAYNLLTVDLIVKTGERKSIKNQGRFFSNVWKSHHWEIHGKRYTLHQIEHDILRPMGDARIHMAIVCASLSCPDLRREAYRSKNLSAQLEEQTRIFVRNQAKGVKIKGKSMKLSKIFDWFSKDFGGKKGVQTFVSRYLAKAKGKRISDYLTYDWSLNSR